MAKSRLSFFNGALPLLFFSLLSNSSVLHGMEGGETVLHAIKQIKQANEQSENNNLQAVAQERVSRMRKAGGFVTVCGLFGLFLTFGAFDEMLEHDSSMLPMLGVGTVTTACLGYGLDQLFSRVNHNENTNTYDALGLFGRIKKMFR